MKAIPSDPGQTALTGFAMQAVIAIVDGLSEDDWSSVTVEPGPSEETEFQKVDIRWILTGGQSERHDQVKATSRSFRLRDVHGWAEALAAESRSAQKRLVLVGLPSSDVAQAGSHAGVQIVIHPPRGDLYRHDLSSRVAQYCQSQGVDVKPAEARTAAHLLVAKLLLGSAQGRTWTQVELRDEVLSLARSKDTYPQHRRALASLLRSLVNPDGLSHFVSFVDQATPPHDWNPTAEEGLTESGSYTRAVDYLDEKGVLRDPSFYAFLRGEFPRRAWEIQGVEEAAARQVGLTTASVPLTSFLSGSIPVVIRERGWDGIKEHLCRHRGLLPGEYIKGGSYFFAEAVTTQAGMIDLVGVRIDSGGPRCRMYYLCDPEAGLADGGQVTPELRQTLIRVASDARQISDPVGRGHPLFGRTSQWDGYLQGLVREKGIRWISALVIGGRRDRLTPEDSDARNGELHSWRQRFPMIDLDLMTYDRLWK